MQTLIGKKHQTINKNYNFNLKNNFEKSSEHVQLFKKYQFILFLLTQAGYFAVTASLLSTTFLEPSKSSCKKLNLFKDFTSKSNLNNSLKIIVKNSTLFKNNNYKKFRDEVLKNEFYSLAIEWNEECGNKKQSRFFTLSLLAPTLLIIGAIFGSFLSGFLADRFGRKPIVVGSLLIVCVSNAGVAFFGNFSLKFFFYTVETNPSFFFDWNFIILQRSIIFVLFFVLGSACGSYMVTNVVFLIEAIHDSKNLRFLVVALNGWPLGMIYTAIIGVLAMHWKIFYFIISATAVVLLLCLEIFSFESFRWHFDRGDYQQAIKIHKNLNKRYTKLHDNSSLIYNCSLYNFKEKNSVIQKYSYYDLFTETNISIPLCKLCYCFFSSSVVSYGLIFLIDVLPGNRYLNMAVMGFTKFLLGCLAFIISFKINSRFIMIFSLCLSCIFCWALIGLTYLNKYTNVFKNTENDSNSLINNILLITIFVVLLTAILDPVWKINHLYSIEFFPTQVRNMSRGLCNAAARIGSLSGPLIVWLKSIDESYAFWIFVILLMNQCGIAFSLQNTIKCKNEKKLFKTKKNKQTNVFN